MNWLKVALLAVVVAPWRAVDSPSTPQVAPTVITGRISMSFDPVSRSCIPSLVVGLNTNATTELVVAWSELGKSVPSLDGDVTDANGPVPLPWWSQSRRLSFSLPNAEALGQIHDIRVVCAVRIVVGLVKTTYVGDTYFSILDEPHVWPPLDMVLEKKVVGTDDPVLTRVAVAESAVNELHKLETARREYSKYVRMLGASAPENEQPHIGPAGGLHLTFVAPQPAAPPGTLTKVTIESATMDGPGHGNDPLQIWMWMQADATQNRVCADAITLLKTEAFYKFMSVPPSVIPLQHVMDVATFDVNKMSFAAGTKIRIFCLIQERSGTPATVRWRLHFGIQTAVPTLAPGATQDMVYLMAMCPTASAAPPQ
jgi:hypothetical protein